MSAPELHERNSREAEVERLLSIVGWRHNRRVPDLVANWRSCLETENGFRLHPAAEAALLEYGGLHVGTVGPGLEVARSDIAFDPSLADGEEDRFLQLFPELRGRNLFPLGEVHHGHGFLAIAENGEVFLIMDEIFGRWPTLTGAIEALLLGLRLH